MIFVCVCVCVLGSGGGGQGGERDLHHICSALLLPACRLLHY